MSNFCINDLAYIEAVDESSIVTNGMVLFWDASNRKCYYGYETTVRDLSGQGNHGTWTGTPSWNNSSKGVFQFNNGNYIRSTISLYNGQFTIMSAARLTGPAYRRIIGGVNNNWLLGTWNGAYNKFYSDGWVTNSTNSPPITTEWRIYTGIGDTVAASYSFYTNMTLIAGPNGGGTHGPNGIELGGDGQYNETSNGEVGFLLMYNRVLNLSEIQQNYNVLKWRFGL